MTALIKLTSECRVSLGQEGRLANALTLWLASLPSEATLEPITYARGHQLDPEYVLVGLRAHWTEIR